MKQTRLARGGVLPAVSLAASLLIVGGCATTSSESDGAKADTFRIMNLGNTITLPVDFVRDAEVMNATGLAVIMPGDRSITVDTRTHGDFAEPIYLPDYPLYVFGLKEPSTDDGLSDSMVDDLKQARGIAMYGPDKPKDVRELDTRHGTAWLATTDGEAFMYMVTEGYSAGITEVYIRGFSAEEVNSWVNKGWFQ